MLKKKCPCIYRAVVEYFVYIIIRVLLFIKCHPIADISVR